MFLILKFRGTVRFIYCSEVVITLDFESSITNSNPGKRRYHFILVFQLISFCNLFLPILPSLIQTPTYCHKSHPNSNILSRWFRSRCNIFYWTMSFYSTPKLYVTFHCKYWKISKLGSSKTQFSLWIMLCIY